MANVVLNFNAFLEKTKLKDDGSNYTDWVRNLRIILIVAKKDYVLEAPLGEAPIPQNQDVMNAWQQRADGYSLVQCGMLYSLEPGLQKRFEQHGAYEMFEELKLVFQAHARVERYEVSDKFFSCKMEENSSVNTYSECLGYTTACLSWELISRMTRSLTESFSRFHRATRAL